MNLSRLSLCLVLAATSAVAWQTGQGQGSIKDAKGNMSITGIANARQERKGNSLSFKAGSAEGHNLIGIWKSQGLRIESPRIDGTANLKEGVGLELSEATMTGGVKVIAERPSSIVGAKEKQTATITTPSATLDLGGNKVTTKGSVTIVNDDPAANQKMVAKGTSGVIVLEDVSTRRKAVKSATLEGPVSLDLTGQREEGEAGKPKRKIPYLVKGRAGRLVFDAVARTITLTGDVFVSSDDPVIGGDVRATKAVIELDEAGEVKAIDLSGPGQTTYREKGGGG
ncbi:MAG TPA: hypothetical protein PKA27_11700 [Fimbriimonadaceae bacterium]|nr:hypothetical protein [Fimbriimonadaceae bacterium]